jgi:methionyl-tRNA synthetase
VFAHGWLLFEHDKMSKSRGNIVRATPIQEVMGFDALRYFLLREIVFGSDGSFSFDALVNRYNADLTNGLGNLSSRALTMIRNYCAAAIPASAGDATIAAQARETISSYLASMEKFEFSKALEALWALLGAVDRYIVQQEPWKIAKKPQAQEQLAATLYTAVETLRIATVLLAPVLPESTARIWAQLGMTTPLTEVDLNTLTWGQLPAGQIIGEVTPVFPRLDPKISIDKMRALEVEETARQAAIMGRTPAAPAEPATPFAPLAPRITIDDFVKIDMRVGLILSAEPVKGADKLLHMQVDIGEGEPRSIVAGIATAYKPEELVGRKVAIVANLEPRKLRGVESNGMVVAASLEGGQPVLAAFPENTPIGARLK